MFTFILAMIWWKSDSSSEYSFSMMKMSYIDKIIFTSYEIILLYHELKIRHRDWSNTCHVSKQESK